MPTTIETHPLLPFVPTEAHTLFLGSFPPAAERWSMSFFYPNFNNDMWRIMGLCYCGNKDFFVDLQNHTFKLDLLTEHLTASGIAIYDVAKRVIRTKGTASDKDLQIVEQTDLAKLIGRMPKCTTIVSTGQKSAQVVSEQTGCTIPPMGGYTDFIFIGRELRFYRMPSTSRAYPMALTKKADLYKQIFERK